MITVAHEFNHATQFAYTYRDGYTTPINFWFYENCASYIADEIYDFEYMYFQNFWYLDPLNNPELRIDTQGADTELYVYAGFIWPMFLTEWTEEDDVVRAIWERMGQNPGENIMSDIDFILNQPLYEKSLTLALKEYAVWRYFTGIRADQNTLKSTFPTAKTKNNNSYPTDNKNFDSMGGLGGVNFIVFTGNYDVLNIFMNGADNMQWEAIYLKDNGYYNFSEHIFPLDSNGDGSLEIIKRDFNNIVLIPICFTPTKFGGQGIYSATVAPKRAVKFTNRYLQENLGGQLLLNNNDNVNSGDLRILSYNSYPVKTKNERFTGSTIRKHNNWNNQNRLYFLNRNFPVTSEGDVDQNAQFNNLSFATVRNVIDGVSFNDGVPIRFNDPWFVKDANDNQSGMGDFIPFISPYYPTGKFNQATGGVFIDQSGPPLWNPPYYSVRAPLIQDAFLTTTGRTHRFYFQNWSWSGASLHQVGSNPPGYDQKAVVFTGSNAVVNANLKGTQLSNQSNAYNTNSQRKAVRLVNGNLINIYSSLGKIWIEKSSDNGQSWSLLNGVNPLYNQDESFAPSLDEIPWSGPYPYFVIVNGYVTSAIDNKIRLNIIRTNSPYNVYSDEIFMFKGQNVPLPFTPVVAVSEDRILIVCNGGIDQNGQVGLIYFYGTLALEDIPGISITWTDGYPGYKIVPGTTEYSKNPSLVVNKSDNKFHLTWQENDQIKYRQINELSDGSLSFPVIYTISAPSPFRFNKYPSISLANGYPIVSWTGISNSDEENPDPVEIRRAVIRRGPVWGGDLQIAGDDVNFTNNNSASSITEKTVIVWSERINSPRTKWMKRTGSSYSTPKNLSHSGIQAQVITGSDYDNMTSIVFNNNQQPYYFSKTTTDFTFEDDDGGEERLNKISSLTDTVVTFGRAGIVNINGVVFVFNVGDIIVEDSIIAFIEKPDTLISSSAEEMNAYTKSSPFELNSSSNFYFSNIFYVVNKDLADSALAENDNVNFKAELIRLTDGVVVGEFDNITYNKQNLSKYASISYQVNCSGIQPGEYYLRLVTSVDGSSIPGGTSYALANIMNESPVLEKISGSRAISFTGVEQPLAYELFQNYPNPFNPSTTIRYTIPNDGFVSLKVYDILGKEVTHLVNEHKTAGNYEVNFNAGKLASGVYFYRITAGDYISTKKMMLVK